MNNRILIIDALVFEQNKAFGFQEYLFNLLNYFFDNREDLLFNKIILLCDKKEVTFFEKFSTKIEIKGYKISNIFLRFILQSIIPFSLNLKRNDVILNLCNYSGLFKQSKNILVIHDLLYLRKNLFKNFLIRFQRKIFIPRSISLADKIIAISDFTRNDILKNFKIPSQTSVIKIYNYFNFEKYVFNDSTKRDNLVPFFLSVSSSAYHKNTITVLKAFNKFCQFDNKKYLYFVGSISELTASIYYNQLSPNVKNRIKIFSNISNEEMGKLYCECEAFISATLFEGLGMPIVEAMYFNAQLILSDIEITREITENNAFFFNPNSFEELYDKMINLETRKINTKTYVKNRFASNNTSIKYIEIINNV
ncbi:glycosyltransferase family 4 protein [Aquirufa sp. OSTEICH-129A]